MRGLVGEPPGSPVAAGQGQDREVHADFPAPGGGHRHGGGGDEATGETYELKLATHYNTEHAGYAAIEKAVAAIEEQTGGAVKISVYPSSQLGDYTVTYQDLGSGAVDLALIPCPSEYDPRIEMNFVPYMFSGF